MKSCLAVPTCCHFVQHSSEQQYLNICEKQFSILLWQKTNWILHFASVKSELVWHTAESCLDQNYSQHIKILSEIDFRKPSTSVSLALFRKGLLVALLRHQPALAFYRKALEWRCGWRQSPLATALPLKSGLGMPSLLRTPISNISSYLDQSDQTQKIFWVTPETNENREKDFFTFYANYFIYERSNQRLKPWKPDIIFVYEKTKSPFQRCKKPPKFSNKWSWGSTSK